MARNIPIKLKIGAIDKVSRVLERITKKFPKMTRAVRRGNTAFKIMQLRTEKLRRSLNKLGRKMKGVGRSMVTGLTLPIGLAAGAIVRTAFNFEKSINKVGAITRTIVDGKVTPAFVALEKEAMRLGRTTEFSAGQAADAMVEFGKAGFESGQIIESTSDILALASATGFDLAFTASTMAKTIKAFGLEAKDAGRVSDVLADISRRANVDLETLSETFKDAAPIARAYGATLEQTAAITGLLGDVGIQGSKAGTTLKAIMLKLATASPKASKALKALGISVETNEKGMRDVGAILTQLAPALAKFPKKAQLSVINELFGLRGIAGASALMAKAMDEGKNPIAAMTKVMQGATGTAKEMQKIMQRGSVGAFARFRSALEGVAIAIAKSGLLDFVADLAGFFTKVFSAVAKMSPSLLKMITIFFGIVAVLGPMLVVMGFMASAVTALITFFGALSAAGITLGAVMAFITGPIGLTVLAVMALIAVGAILMDNWDGIKEFFEDIWGSIVDSFKRGAGFIGNIMKNIPGLGFLSSALTSFSSRTGNGPQFGASAGAREKQRMLTSNRDSTTTNNASVSVDFKNIPKGTRIRSEASGPNILNLGTVGALQ